VEELEEEEELELVEEEEEDEDEDEELEDLEGPRMPTEWNKDKKEHQQKSSNRGKLT
jgi:hypothetical protein